jgi:hypothetical protein
VTIKQLIEYVDEIRPNSFGNHTKTVWINEIEGAVQTEIMGIYHADVAFYDATADIDTELLVKAPHAKLYAWYLIAMMDLVSMGNKAYENSYRVFNSFWGEYARWYLRTHRML